MEKRMKKSLAIGLSLVLMITALSGCGGGEAKSSFNDGFPENVLRLTLDGEIETADPQITTEDYDIPLNIYDTPITVKSNEDGTSELIGSLAETWDVSEDGLVYTLHLRKGVKFHNGEEMVADDFLYTIDRMLNPARMARNTGSMDMIKGAKDMLDGKIKSVEGVGVNLVDDYTVEIVLESAYAPFLSIMCVPAWSIYNRKAGDAADEAGGGISGSYFGAQAEYTIGTGPFKMTEWVLNDHIYLEANADYWQGAPKLEGVLFSIVTDADTLKMMYESGKVDIFDLDNAREQIGSYMESDEYKDNIVSKTRVGTYYFSINQRIKPFDDVRVRKALQMTIDRQSILDSMYGGTGTVASGILPPGLVGYNENLPEIPYDQEAAKKLLAEAGYAEGFEMTICQVADNPATLAVNEIVQAQLAEIGIKVTIEQMDEASWFDGRRTGDLPMYMSSWSADFNDPDNFIYTFFSSESTVTRSFNYANQDTIKRVEAARYLIDPEKRVAEYQDLEKEIIQEDAAWIPLFFLQKVRLVSDRVENFTPHWAGWGSCNYYTVNIVEK